MTVILRDLGERRIVSEILPRYVVGVGNDCAVLDSGDGRIAVTTDPVPEPAAKLLGADPDLYWMGWLLVVINASDLAATGAIPMGLVAAIEAPPTLPLSDFERLLQGIADACHAEELTFVGGNLREGTKVSAVGTAIGTIPRGKTVSRAGALDGDILVSVGLGGMFWRDVLIIKSGSVLRDRNLSPVFRPRSQLRAMRFLADAGLVAAAIDNSDGFLPSLFQLATANSVCVEIDLDRLQQPPGSQDLDIDPARLWLGWGDWNVIAAIHPQHLQRAVEVASAAGSTIVPVGKILNGDPQVMLRRCGNTSPAPRLESERFAKDSWFDAGVEKYVEILLSVELPGDERMQ
jgi:thiamine-monophosphate kinase